MTNSEYLLYAVSVSIFEDDELNTAIEVFGSEDAFEEWIDCYVWNRNDDLPSDSVLTEKARRAYSEYLFDKEMSEDTEALYSYINSQDEV